MGADAGGGLAGQGIATHTLVGARDWSALRAMPGSAPSSIAWPMAARRGASVPFDGAVDGTDDGAERVADIVRLYRLVLDAIPDRPGLRHHADLLAAGHTLAGLAASLLSLGADAQCRPVERAALLWRRDGRGRRGFAAAWRQTPDLPHFVASLIRHPPLRSRSQLCALFPEGVDPALDDVYPGWAYRLWSAEIRQVLVGMARRLMPLLRLAGPRIVLSLDIDRSASAADLDATLSSLARQIYGRWSLSLTGPFPAGFSLPPDPRIGRAATGPRPCLHGALRPGDTLSPACLALFAYAALRRPGIAGWSCDQDRRDPDGFCTDPQLDPIRRDGLVLRRHGASAPGGATRHLPAVLLHRLARTTRAAATQAARTPVRFPARSRVSVVIATRDRAALLRRCIESLREVTAGPAPEIVLVDNGSREPDALALLASLQEQGCTVLRRPGSFNWSLLNNAGVRASSGEIVVLLNNDTECIEADWLERLASACLDPAAGPVGARLLYADGTVQHAGVLIGPGPHAAHRWSPDGETGIRSVSAVTGACMAVRRTLFDRLGGFDEALPVTWNDLDFCLRARAAGLDVRLCSDSVLRHHELGTRTPDSAPENQDQLARTRAYIARRHAGRLGRDRFLHPLAMAEAGGRLLDPEAPRWISALVASGGVD